MRTLKQNPMAIFRGWALSALCTAAVALTGVAGAQVTVSVSNGVQTNCGAAPPSVSVTLTATNLNNATDFGVDLDYDLSKLTFVSFTRGEALSNWGLVNAAVRNNGTPGDPSDDFLRIGGAALAGTPATGASVVLGTIVFNCQPGNCPAIDSITPFNMVDALAGATAQAGTVQCGEFPTLIFEDATAGCPANQLAVNVIASELTNATDFGFDAFFSIPDVQFVSFARGPALANWGLVNAALRNNGTPGDPSDDFVRIGGAALAGTPATGTNVLLGTITFNCLTCPSTSNITATNLVDALNGFVVDTGALSCVDDVPPVAICVDAFSVNLSTGSITPGQLNNGSNDPDDDPITLTINGGASYALSCADVANSPITLTLGVEANGQSDSCTVQVTVVDDIAPTVSVPGISVNLNAAGTATINAGSFTNNSTDNCGGATTITNVSPTTFNCSNRGNNAVQVTVSDAAGNLATGSVNVEVLDATPPAVNVPGITVNLSAAGTATINAGSFTNNSTDACGPTTITNVTPTSFTCANIGPNNVTVTVQDGSGLTATGTVVVTVADVTPPSVTAKNISVTLDVYGNASITAADVTDTATDNCSTPTVGIDVSTFDCDDLGPNTVVVTATDGSNNSATANATVTVIDDLPPTLDVVTEPIVLELGANGTAQLLASAAVVYTNDNCAVNQGSLAASKTTFNCADIGDNEVTISIADTSGNVTSKTITVTVQDNIAPTAAAQDITVALGANGTASITAASIDNGSSDNCSVTLAIDITDFDCSDVGTPVTVTLTATDQGGLTDTATAVVTVVDNLSPVLTVPATAGVALDAEGNGSISIESLAVSATDNCGTPSLSISRTAFTCEDAGATINVVVTATDASNNVSTATIAVTVTDPTGGCTPEEGQVEDECLDLDDNGIVDNLDCLDEGIIFGLTNVGVAGGCLLETRQVLFTNVDDTGTVTLPVPDPNNFEVTVDVTIPRSVIPVGESAYFVAKVSCDLANLLSGDASAATLAGNLTRDNVPVEEIIPGTYVLATVFQGTGANVAEVQGVTATITYRGLDVNTVEQPQAYQHGTSVVAGNDGTRTVGDATGEWAEPVTQLVGTDVVVNTNGLSVFVVTQPAPQVPFLSIKPNANYARIIGVVEAGSSRNIEFTLRNTGPGSISGAATVTGTGYSIVGSSTYQNLAGATTRTVTVRFAPATEGTFEGGITFTGGTNGPITVKLWGVGVPKGAKTAFFGCGATDGSGMGFGDVMVLGGLLALLLAGTRFWSRARQS